MTGTTWKETLAKNLVGRDLLEEDLGFGMATRGPIEKVTEDHGLVTFKMPWTASRKSSYSHWELRGGGEAQMTIQGSSASLDGEKIVISIHHHGIVTFIILPPGDNLPMPMS